MALTWVKDPTNYSSTDFWDLHDDRGRVPGVYIGRPRKRPTEYTLSGDTWGSDFTAPTLEAAQEHAIALYVAQLLEGET